MNFYFCESCGKRVTEQDIEAGRARNKQLKGIYCTSCGAGVMTLEMQAVSPDDLKKIMRKSGGTAVPPASGESSPKLEKNTPAAPHSKSAMRPHAAPLNGKLVAGAALMGVILAVVTTLALSGSRTRRPLQKDERADHQSGPVEQLPPSSAQPPVASGGKPAKPDPEQLAKEAFETLQRFEGLAAGDGAGRIERIDAFLAAHGDSAVSGKARALRSDLVAALPAPSKDPAATPEPKPESTKVAEPVPAVVTPAPGSVPTPPTPAPAENALAPVLRECVGSLAQAGASAALRTLEQHQGLAGEPGNALKAALTALQKREKAWRDGLAKLVGQKVRAETTTGIVEGALLAIQGDTLKIDKPLMLDGVVRGSAMVNVALADISSASRETLVPLPAASTPEEWAGQALMSLARQNVDAAATALANLDGHPLQSALRDLTNATREAAFEKKAQNAWKDIETQGAAKLAQSQAKTLLAAIARFEAEFAAAQLLKDAALQQKIAALKDELGRLILGLDPRIAQLFKGKIAAYDPRSQRITIVWDLSVNSANSKDDFEGTDPSWERISWRKEGLYVYNNMPTSYWLQMPQFVSDNSVIKFEYKDLVRINYGTLGVAFFGKDSKTDNPQVYAFVSGGRDCGILDMKTGFIMKTRLATSEPLAKSGTFEASIENKKIVLKGDGKVVLEGSVTKPNDHTGLAIGGGWDTTLLITKLEVTARLDPKWLARKLEALPRK